MPALATPTTIRMNLTLLPGILLVLTSSATAHRKACDLDKDCPQDWSDSAIVGTVTGATGNLSGILGIFGGGD